MRDQTSMGVRIKFHKRAWWIFINRDGRRRAKKIGDKETAKRVAQRIREQLVAGVFNLALSDDPSRRSPLCLAIALRLHQTLGEGFHLQADKHAWHSWPGEEDFRSCSFASKGMFLIWRFRYVR
jgi:hypothetical protein